MTHTKTETMRKAYVRYTYATDRTLNDCYANASTAKHRAFDYCKRTEYDHNGHDGRIIGHNTTAFSYGFIGEINGLQAFFYITRDYDRYIYLDEI